MKLLNANRLNQARKDNPIDIYLVIIWQNRVLYMLVFVIFIGASAVFAVLLTRPVPLLLVDEEGRYVARVTYIDAPPLNQVQLEAMSKRFVQHYLSQNSGTVYEDAEISLAAMCEPLRRKTHRQWVDGGKLVRIIKRLQVSRVVFSDFKLLKYLSADDIQMALAGRVVVSSDSRGDIASDFNLEMSARLVPITSNNYLGIEICSIRLL